MQKAVAIFGERVRALRLASGFTQEDLGRRAKIDYKHLSSIERGMKSPSFDAIEKLAKALGVEYWELFVPVERPATAMKRELTRVLANAQKTSPEQIANFLRELSSAVRTLERPTK